MAKKIPSKKTGLKTSRQKRGGQPTPGTKEKTSPISSHAGPERDQGTADQETALFPVVAVGASAGGIEAFIEMLRALPRKIGMAVVFVEHLDPRQASTLAQILSRETQIPILEAAEGMPVERDHVYVIPRDASLVFRRGRLTLTALGKTSGGQRTTIDDFMRSVAAELQNRAIGVVLSGGQSDGTVGLKAIQAAGGLTFAQDPKTARFDSMPRAAIDAGCAQLVLPPGDIARELARIRKHPYVHTAEDKSELLQDGDDSFPRVMAIVRNATGVDFSQYKSTTVKRRILRRMVLHRVENLSQYLQLLRSTAAEVRALHDDILINVTEFFRDPPAFDALNRIVYSSIMADPRRQTPVRVWVPGCATGEEAYSIAISLLEYAEHRRTTVPIQIFATDISDTALDKARKGVYSPAISRDVSADRLRRYFTRTESGYQINKRIRDICVFARQNLAKDPPFSRIDLVSCRNVLIYLGPALQKRVVPVFHYALKPEGYLLLGASESVSSFSELFTLVDKKHKIYTRKTTPQRVFFDFTTAESASVDPGSPAPLPEPWNERDLQKEADRLILARYGPPGVIVDNDLNILLFRGHTSPFLEPASGAASLNLLNMAREGLAVELRNAMHRARKNNVPVRREGVRVKSDGGFRRIHLEVIPVKHTSGKDRRFLILFDGLKEAAEAAPEKAADKPALVAGSGKQQLLALSRENSRLSEEVNASREYLQSIIEELEASNEELRSANEEVQSANEELQSTNEELETAKEELQSTNEELNTVNEELQTRNLQLGQIGNDLLNLLTNVNIPIVILSNDLRIRRFTPVAERVLNLIPGDVGRPINDIRFNIAIPQLQGLLREVIENAEPKVVEVRDGKKSRFSLRIRPYRTEDNKIDGLVLVLVDLDPSRLPEEARDTRELVGADESLREAREKLRLYARSLIEAQEDERHRVSRELHDDANQHIATLLMELHEAEQGGPHDIKQRLGKMRTSIEELDATLRRISAGLHPVVLEDLGLVPAIEEYIGDVAKREGLKVRFQHGEVPRGIPRGVALCVYRVVQEALRNVVKHSGSDRATVTLSVLDSSLQVAVRDNGSGFDVQTERKSGLGLPGMEERVKLCGGTFHVRSGARGTQVNVQVPFDGREPDSSSN